MSSWRDAVLKDFVPNVSRLTLVADPDGLLAEEKLALALRDRGFGLIEFTDPIEFRYAYESKYRAIWDRGGHIDLVVILRLPDTNLECLPYDLLQTGRKLRFNLGEIFPNFSYPVIEKLDRSLLDAVYDAQRQSKPDRMGDNATQDFILRHVFGIAAELISSDVDLLRILLRLHYGKIKLPDILAERLIQTIRAASISSAHASNFQNWPMEAIIPDSEVFFAFLQERWPVFLSAKCGHYTASGSVREGKPLYPPESSPLAYPGPDLLPFAHEDIRVYIDDLFVEGKLSPVQAPELTVDTASWFRSGIIETSGNDDRVRISRLLERLENSLPAFESRHTDWTAFALKWAELSALVHDSGEESFRSRFNEMGDRLNGTFAEWLKANYAGLINLPPARPAMVHHILRRLVRDMEESGARRIALVVIDGLSLDQWVTVRRILQTQDRNLVIRESAVFAWIPTLTSVSRQSIFSGKTPLYFPTSIHNTQSEGNLWRQFWESNGLSRLDVAYQRSLGDGDAARILEEMIHPGTTRAVGLVVDKIDKIMHGMQLGAAGMHNQIRQWCREGFLASLFGYLLDHEYSVWMTSDHGNIECRGKGRPAEGVIAETRGERVRIYPTKELRSQVAEKFPFAHEWTSAGLPPDYFPLVTGGRDAFVNNGQALVGHGGISMEEVIVPIVKFERKSA